MQVQQSLREIFHNRLLRIPDYQRGYSWGEKQLSDFWEDLLTLPDKKNHYTGMITIKPVSQEKWDNWVEEKWLIEDRRYKAFHVVDGQQRLTTSIILLQSIMDFLYKLKENQEKDDNNIFIGSFSLKEIKETFLCITEPEHKIINTYLFGYETDNPSFKYLRHKITSDALRKYF